MTFRLPAFMVAHPLAGITDIAEISNLANTNTIADASKRAFIDYRKGDLGEFVATGANAGILFDLGATPSETWNRCVIPAGHDAFDGETIAIRSDDNVGLTSTTNRFLDSVSGAGVLDLEFTTPGAERYMTFQVTTSSAETFQLSEIWMGVYDQLSSDAMVGISYANGWRSSVVETNYPGGVASTELAVPRRVFTLDVRNLDPTGADYATLDLVLQNRARPFWYWPPDDNDAGPFLVQLDGDPIRRQEFTAPQVAAKYLTSLRMIETDL